MTAKEYLNQAFCLDQQINSKIRQVEQLSALAQKATAMISGMPKQSGQPDGLLVKIIDLQYEIQDSIDRLVDLKCEITRTINCLTGDHQTILEKRYLLYESWEDIAKDLKYEERQVFRLHGQALLLIKVPGHNPGK